MNSEEVEKKYRIAKGIFKDKIEYCNQRDEFLMSEYNYNYYRYILCAISIISYGLPYFYARFQSIGYIKATWWLNCAFIVLIIVMGVSLGLLFAWYDIKTVIFIPTKNAIEIRKEVKLLRKHKAKLKEYYEQVTPLLQQWYDIVFESEKIDKVARTKVENELNRLYDIASEYEIK